MKMDLVVKERTAFGTSLAAIILLILLTAGNAFAAKPVDSCSTISGPGDYILTMDIMNSSETNCININSNDVILDGAGYTIDGVDAANSTGVYVIGKTNVTVEHLKVTDWNTGIYYQDVTYGSIINNFLDSNSYSGINFVSSSPTHSVSPGYSTIGWNGISNSDYGILMMSSGYNEIRGNNITSNRYSGIVLWFSNNNNITGNTAVLNRDSGIYLEASVGNILIENSVAMNTRGISLFFITDNNMLWGNTVTGNEVGFLFGPSDNPAFTGKSCIKCHPSGQTGFNTFSENVVTSSGFCGVFLNSSGTNTIYNNFFNNINNYCSMLNNTYVWNISKTAGINIIGGPYIGGNVWNNPNGSDYSQTCADSDGDGICDLPYALMGIGTDYLPLMNNIIPPASVTNLRAPITARKYIVWTWTDPEDADFDWVMVYLDGRFMTNVTRGNESYIAGNLRRYSVHTISTHTVDITGNINQTWMNHTARTT